MNRKKRTFSILFFIRRTRLNRDGHAPICMRITIDGKQVSFTTTLYADPLLWNVKIGRLTSRTTTALEINNSLNLIYRRTTDLYRKLMDREGVVYPDKLRDILLGRDTIEKDMTLLALFDKLIAQKQQLSNSGKIKNISIKSYEATRTKIVAFTQEHYRTDNIHISNVGYDFINNFRIYLLGEKSCGHNTMIRYMRHLKQVTTNAFRCKYITHDPFVDVILNTKKTTKIYLTEAELIKILKRDFSGSKVMEEIRDMFAFSCYTGLAYTDMKNLTDSHIKDNAIIKKREKTGTECFIPLLEVSKNIIEKYKNQKYPNNRILPVRACQRMNRYLKDLAKHCGIEKAISTHTARHTFATLMLTKGMSMESVARMLGHTDLKTTQIYAKILKEKVAKEMAEIEKELPLFNKKDKNTEY